MDEEERENLNRLAAKVSILRAFLVEISHRQGLTVADIERLTATIDPATAGLSPDAVEILNQELVAFRHDWMLPIMGTDE